MMYSYFCSIYSFIWLKSEINKQPYLKENEKNLLSAFLLFVSSVKLSVPYSLRKLFFTHIVKKE